MSKWQGRIRRAWIMLRVQGPRRFVRAGMGWLQSAIGKPSAAQRAFREQKARVDAEFDTSFGVATGGVEYLHDLTIGSQNARFGVNHIASDPAEFAAAMADIDLDCRTATFIDFGSGRGRALILAAQWPFARIIGVEFAQELHDACVANLRRSFGADHDRIRPILADATEFAFPDEPLVLYFFNPFDAPIMAAVARQAMASWQAHPRPIRVAYLNPVFGGEWIKAGWRRVAGGPGRAIFAPPV